MSEILDELDLIDGKKREKSSFSRVLVGEIIIIIFVHKDFFNRDAALSQFLEPLSSLLLFLFFL